MSYYFVDICRYLTFWCFSTFPDNIRIVAQYSRCIITLCFCCFRFLTIKRARYSGSNIGEIQHPIRDNSKKIRLNKEVPTPLSVLRRRIIMKADRLPIMFLIAPILHSFLYYPHDISLPRHLHRNR